MYVTLTNPKSISVKEAGLAYGLLALGGMAYYSVGPQGGIVTF